MFFTDLDGRQVQAWQIPPFGDAAEEDLPDWLVERLIEGTIEITDIGGLRNILDPKRPAFGVPGDYVVQYKNDEILFCSNTTFIKNYLVA